MPISGISTCYSVPAHTYAFPGITISTEIDQGDFALNLPDFVGVREQWKDPKMEAEMEQKIEKTVRNILESSNMDDVTEYKIRKQASEELALDLSKPPYKAFVRQVVQSFLEKQQQKQEQEEEEAEEEEEEDEEKRNGRDYDDEGNLIICKVGLFPFRRTLFLLFGCWESVGKQGIRNS